MTLQETWDLVVPHTDDDQVVAPVTDRLRVVTYLRKGFFADAMQDLMEQECFDVIVADDGDSLVELGANADGCIVDLAMDGALDSMLAMTHECAHVRVAVIADARDRGAAFAAAHAACATYVSSDDSVDRLLAFLRGEAVQLDRRTRAGRTHAQLHREGRDPRRLTTRESEILEGLLDGENTKVLAARLGVSQATARTHVQSVLSKLGVHSRLEAVALVNGDLGGAAIDLFDPASRRPRSC